MGIEIVILDFDGTLTDIDKEAVLAIESWKRDVGEDLGLTSEEVQKRWVSVESKIKADSKNYGWSKNGKIVASACADPFVMATVTSQMLFDEEGRHLDTSERDDLLYKFFINGYEKTNTVFKSDADKFLLDLKEKFSVYIVTNSDASKVSAKIQQLPSNHSAIPIYGNAKKFNLHPDWEEVPESVERKGFGRPLFLRRKQYGGILQTIMEEKGVLPNQIAVVGDIYELDLLLPEHMGMSIILTPRDSTADFELATVSSYSKGYVAENLEKVIGHLDVYK